MRQHGEGVWAPRALPAVATGSKPHEKPRILKERLQCIRCPSHMCTNTVLPALSKNSHFLAPPGSILGPQLLSLLQGSAVPSTIASVRGPAASGPESVPTFHVRRCGIRNAGPTSRVVGTHGESGLCAWPERGSSRGERIESWPSGSPLRLLASPGPPSDALVWRVRKRTACLPHAGSSELGVDLPSEVASGRVRRPRRTFWGDFFRCAFSCPPV